MMSTPSTPALPSHALSFPTVRSARRRIGRLAGGLWMLALGAVVMGPASAGGLLGLDTPEGAARLMSAPVKQQFFAVQPYLDTQQNLAFCGPASIAAVLNSLPVRRPVADNLAPYTLFTQDNLFSEATRRIKAREAVLTRGMTLPEMAGFLNALGVRARTVPADQLTLDGFRSLLREILARPDARLIANYSRPALGQPGGGHQSPLAAYDDASDAVLVLDVAKFKFPPTWVGAADLLAAMQTVDSDSGRSRGLVVVELPQGAPAP